jgi:hypothetical protein
MTATGSCWRRRAGRRGRGRRRAASSCRLGTLTRRAVVFGGSPECVGGVGAAYTHVVLSGRLDQWAPAHHRVPACQLAVWATFSAQRFVSRSTLAILCCSCITHQ